jgi:hypothetical protein
MPLSVEDFSWGACMPLSVVYFTLRCIHAFFSGRCYLEVHVCLYQW